jgi:hypothetical protein
MPTAEFEPDPGPVPIPAPPATPPVVPAPELEPAPTVVPALAPGVETVDVAAPPPIPPRPLTNEAAETPSKATPNDSHQSLLPTPPPTPLPTPPFVLNELDTMLVLRSEAPYPTVSCVFTLSPIMSRRSSRSLT